MTFQFPFHFFQIRSDRLICEVCPILIETPLYKLINIIGY